MFVLVSKKKFDSEIARRASEACDQIASEMGAEIHDDLIQKLSIFRLYIDRIEKSSGDKAEIEALAIRMRTDFEQVVRAVKSISRRLLPVRMEGDTLVNTINLLCQSLEVPGTGHIHFESSGECQDIDRQKEMYILRIIQELIQNAFRHSSAWHVWVRLKCEDKCMIIEVEDDGSGFAKIPEFITRLKKKHNTLRMRALALGGSIEYLQGKDGLLAQIKIPSTQL